jgi:hypothetical protein
MCKLFFLLATLFICMLDISYAANPTAERPRYAEGDYWIYAEDGKDGKITFLREETDRYIFEKGGTQVVKDFNLTTIEKTTGGYPGPVIKFPITVGKWWNYEFEADSDTGTKRWTGRIAKYEVESYEQIAVPAGTFWAFKIAVNIVGSKFQHAVGSANYWYAPEVKNIIKGSYKGKMWELKQYEVK